MNSKVKKAIIVILPLVFALTASIAIAMMIGSSKTAIQNDESPTETDNHTMETLPVFNDKEEKEIFSEGLSFKSLDNGTCTIIGLGNCKDEIIKIPTHSDFGEIVTEISSNAFERSLAKKIIIPNTVISIKSKAFNESSVEYIYIGNSVMAIETSAFSSCKNLSEIVCSEANATFTTNNGVLYSRDMKTLIYYPTNKNASSYTIPKSVKTIASGAFSSCKNLTSISFGGTEKQWRSVLIESDNGAIKSAKMSFAPAEK